MESKEREFVEQENRNPRLSIEEWLQRYIFTDLHEIFFATFPIVLHEWLSRLADNKTWTQSDRSVEWSPEKIERLKHTNKPISREVDFWLNSLLEGFVTKFAVYILKAYINAERYFLKDIMVST